MIYRISNFNELITEVKVVRKSAKTSKIKYHDILGLPGYANLRKIGMTLPIEEPTIFRSSGSLSFLMEKDSIIVINQDLYSKLSNLNPDHYDILHIIITSDGTVVYYGLLTKNRHLKYKGRPLNSLENYTKPLSVGAQLNVTGFTVSSRAKLRGAQRRPSIIAACWKQATLW